MLHQPQDYFDLSTTAFADLFTDVAYVWDAIPQIAPYIQHRLETDRKPNITTYDLPPTVTYKSPNIYIGEGVTFEPHVYIEGPAIIEDGAFIGHGAFLRYNTIIGKNGGVGNSCETKNVVLMENATAPHFAYLGDSIIGQNVNLGAGVKLSNFPVKFMGADPLPTIILDIDGELVDTGLSKFGAILGDDVKLGCNSVCNPGTVVGKGTWVYALASLAKGIYPPNSLVKLRQTLEIVEKHDK
jgi:NDP-sugar pyrophosphorylase family protein